MAEQDLHIDGSGGGGDSDCPCDVYEADIENGTLNVDLSSLTTGKYYYNFIGNNWAINLPQIVASLLAGTPRGVELYFCFKNAGTVVLTPNATDSLGTGGAGVALTGSVKAGDTAYLWIGDSIIWGGIGPGGGGSSNPTVNYAFTSTAGQMIYTLAQIQAALVGGFAGNLTGKIVLVHVNGVSYISGGGDATINGSGGITLSFDPGNGTIVVEII